MNEPPEIEVAFAEFAPEIRRQLMAARDLILEEGASAEGVEAVSVTLKWGQPSYAPQPKTGTPIRLGVTKGGAPALFVHCGTSLIEDWLALAGPDAPHEGRRAALIGPEGPEPLRLLVRAALTCHRRR
ncbi:MAG: DUF1801 domain-containing protein [Paracoccaceae bacterium]